MDISTFIYDFVYYLSWKNVFVDSSSTYYWKMIVSIIIFTILLLTIGYGISGILASMYGIDNNSRTLHESTTSKESTASKKSTASNESKESTANTQPGYIQTQIRQFITDTQTVLNINPSSTDTSVTSEPDTSQPGKSQPVKSQPGKSQPGKSQPGKSQPGKSQPGKSQPDTVDTVDTNAYNKSYLQIYEETMINMVTIQIIGFILLFFILIMININSSININKNGYHFFNANNANADADANNVIVNDNDNVNIVNSNRSFDYKSFIDIFVDSSSFGIIILGLIGIVLLVTGIVINAPQVYGVGILFFVLLFGYLFMVLNPVKPNNKSLNR